MITGTDRPSDATFGRFRRGRLQMGDPMDEGGGVPSAASAPVVAPLPDPETLRPLGEEVHFHFGSKLFGVPGMWFAKTADLRQAAMFIPMGDFTACVPMPALMTNFNVRPGSNDHRMLRLIEDGLEYVKRITPGERIPREVLDGTASWSVEVKHHGLARAKLVLRLARATGQSARLPANLTDLPAFGASDEAGALVTEFLEKLPPSVAAGRDRIEFTRAAEALVHETSYVEALRDKMTFLQKIHDFVGGARSRFETDRDLSDEIVMMQMLMRRPRNDCRVLFVEIDKVLDDVGWCLRNWLTVVERVRATRNALHKVSVDWAEMDEKWKRPPIQPEQLAPLLRETYRFLALRYSAGAVWSKR